MIDYEKYQMNQKISERVRRQADGVANATQEARQLHPDGNYTLIPFYPPEIREADGGKPCKGKAGCQERPKSCADPENEVYQKCGNKCVLGCRYATSSTGITLAKHDCEKNDCVEGCFCKTGLVRHQNKCIPASECPIRKCIKNEVYVSRI